MAVEASGAKLAGAEINIMVSVFLLAALAAGYCTVWYKRGDRRARPYIGM